MNKTETKAVPHVCKNCRFWKHKPVKESKDEFGECHRQPPIPIVYDDAVVCVLPSTEWKDFCGEFKTRVDA